MPPGPTWRKHWPEFETVLKARLDAGARAYGDNSFARPPTRLVDEIEQEALDIIGWGFVLWVRLQALKEKARGLSAHSIAAEK